MLDSADEWSSELFSCVLISSKLSKIFGIILLTLWVSFWLGARDFLNYIRILLIDYNVMIFHLFCYLTSTTVTNLFCIYRCSCSRKQPFTSATLLASLQWLLVLWTVWLTTWGQLVQKQLMLPMLCWMVCYYFMQRQLLLRLIEADSCVAELFDCTQYVITEVGCHFSRVVFVLVLMITWCSLIVCISFLSVV